LEAAAIADRGLVDAVAAHKSILCRQGRCSPRHHGAPRLDGPPLTRSDRAAILYPWGRDQRERRPGWVRG
jgi:hypothetical protein